MIQQEKVNYQINAVNWSVIKFKFDLAGSIYQKAITQAKKKSVHTMSAAQNGAYRSPEMKYNMQLMGIIAEIGCQEYLNSILKENSLDTNWKVTRYDDVRTDNFTSPNNEYDIKIENTLDSSICYYVESRSSITYNRSFIDGLKQFDIIGSYSSVAKSQESKNDIYLRPLYEYKLYQSKTYSKLNFEKLFEENSIILYLVAGCTYDEMVKNGFQKSMGQGSTKYNVLPIVDAKDAQDFKNSIIELLS